MKTATYVALLILIGCSWLTADAADALPFAINDHFSSMAPGPTRGKTFGELIPMANVQLLATKGIHIIDSPADGSGKPRFDPSKFFQELWRSNNPAKEYALHASESTLADFSIVTKDGRLFLIEIVFGLVAEKEGMAILLNGDGYGCRIEANEAGAAAWTKAP